MAILTGVIAGLAAMVFWGSSDYFSKFVMQKITLKQMLVWNALIAFLAMLPIGFLFWNTPNPNLSSLLFAIAGGVFNGIALLCFYIALSKENLSLVSALGSAYPAITIILSVFILHEIISLKEGIGIALILIGLFAASISSLKGTLSFSKATPLLITAVIFWGFGFFFYKFSIPGIGWYATALIATIAQLIIFCAFALRKENMRAAIEKKTMPVIISAAILSAAGITAYSFGLSVERVSIVTPISALFPVVAIILGVFLLKEKLLLHQSIGIAAVIIGVVITSI